MIYDMDLNGYHIHIPWYLLAELSLYTSKNHGAFLSDLFLTYFVIIHSRSKENGFHERPPASLEPPAKRICTISPAPRHSPAHPLQLPTQIHPTPPPLQHYALDDISTPQLYREPHRILELRELKDRPRLPGADRRQLEFEIAFKLLVNF